MWDKRLHGALVILQEVASEARVGWGSIRSRYTVEKGPRTEGHSGPPKVDAREEETVPAHGDVTENRRWYGYRASRWGA